ncbi:MAG: helix-turn-helix transcriptional regulator [Dehalococcoidia bacterium]
METTRDQILRIVRGHREATVSQIAETMGLTHQAVRRHLDGLRADGLIEARLERHGVGRPSLLFSVTDRGDETAGRTYLQLLSRLFRHIEKEPEGERKQMLEEMFSGIAQEVAAEHVSEVRGQTLDERVAQVTRALEGEGIADGWRKDGDVFHIHNGECPYIRLAALSDAPCRSDRQSIELLVGAAVEQTRRIVDGAPLCEYVIRPEPLTLVEDKGNS